MQNPVLPKALCLHPSRSLTVHVDHHRFGDWRRQVGVGPGAGEHAVQVAAAQRVYDEITDDVIALDARLGRHDRPPGAPD